MTDGSSGDDHVHSNPSSRFQWDRLRDTSDVSGAARLLERRERVRSLALVGPAIAGYPYDDPDTRAGGRP